MAQSDEEQPIVVQSATTSSKGNTALEKENVLLRDQVIRLNKELYRYQKNAGTTSSTSSDRHQDDNEVMKSLSESEVTSPLFTAYDQRIEELSTFIERQGSVLDLLTERSNDLLSENEHLRHRIIQGLPKHKSDGIQESSTDIKKDAGINQLLSDKQLLEEQAELLVKEVQSANQTITSRDENIASLTEQVGNKLKEMQRLQKSMLQLAKHKADCEKELVTHIGHLAIQSDEIKDLKCCVDKLKKELSEQSSKAEGSDMDQQYLKGENETLTTKVNISKIIIELCC
jgi:chromosome segregation ATPase